MQEIYNWLLLQIQTNQFFAGIAIPFVLGTAAYLLRSIPRRIYYYLKLILTLEFTVTTRNEHYDEILKFLYQHRYSLFSRNYSISNSSQYLTPGYGTSVGMYKGVVFIFHRQIFEQKIDLQEQTHITFLTRNLKFIDQFFKDCTHKETYDTINVFAQQAAYFNKLCTRPKRALDTVFVNNHIKEKLIERINWFLSNEQWYIDRGISYKLCILLHGIPGTGKTSLIYALASHFGYDIKLINDLANIDSILTDDADRNSDPYTFTPMSHGTNIKSLYVVEDIDCLTLKKRDVEPKQVPLRLKDGTVKMTTWVPTEMEQRMGQEPALLSSYNNLILQKILNTLDGIGTPHGRIIFITTNNVDSLDAALIRKGRVDSTILIDKLDDEKFVEMFVSFYGTEYRHLADQFISDGKYIPQIGANLSDLFLNSSPEQSLIELEGNND